MCADAIVASVTDREARAEVLFRLDFVEQRDGIVLCRYPALSVFVQDEVVAGESEPTGALAGLDEGGGTEVGPLEVVSLFAKNFQRIAVRVRDRVIHLGKVRRVEELDPGRDL